MTDTLNAGVRVVTLLQPGRHFAVHAGVRWGQHSWCCGRIHQACRALVTWTQKREEDKKGLSFETHAKIAALALFLLFMWESPDLRFSEPVQLQCHGTKSGGSRCWPEPPHSSCTGGGLVASLPKCRTCQGSLPWRKNKEEGSFNLKSRYLFIYLKKQQQHLTLTFIW